MLYKDSLIAHQWSPAVPCDKEYVAKERQWLLIDSQSDTKCAFLHCYIACQSTASESFLSWNEDLFGLITAEAVKLRRQGFMVVAMGDFNSKIGVVPGLEGNRPDKNRNEPMFQTFVSEVNLFILNTLPTSKGVFTRFMGDGNQPEASSLLDYGLIDSDHINSCTSFTIDDQARFDCGSDHALLECDIVMGRSPRTNWSYHDVLQYNYNDNTDFTVYKQTLDNNMGDVSLTSFNALKSDEMLTHISKNLNLSAKQVFGLKVKKGKKSGMRLPKNIVTLIKAKNSLCKLIRVSPPLLHEDREQMVLELKAMKFKIKDSIADVKFKRRTNLRSKLLKADPTRKRFWRFLKSQTKAAGVISAVYKVKDFIYDFIDHFRWLFRKRKWYLNNMKLRMLSLTILPPSSRGRG